jgi:hypothetical protein
MGHQSVSALVVGAGEITLQLFQNNFQYSGTESGNLERIVAAQTGAEISPINLQIRANWNQRSC